MKRFFYNVYGYTIGINVDMPLLTPIRSSEYDYLFNVEYVNSVENESIALKNDRGIVSISLGMYADIVIDNITKTVTYHAVDYESFFSTVFNIPFSVIHLLNNEFLIHSSSILYEEGVICFLGDKGTGKSTLVSIMSEKCESVDFFSDDTIRIDKDLRGYWAHNLLKLDNDILGDISQDRLTEHYNVSGKRYILYDSPREGKKVKALVFCERNSSIREHRIDEINGEVLRNAYLIKNIIGVRFLDSVFLGKALRETKNYFKRLRLFRLRLPNSMDYLLQNISVIKEDVIKTIQNLY